MMRAHLRQISVIVLTRIWFFCHDRYQTDRLNFKMNEMQEALRLAKQAAAEDEVPVGAVVVCNGQIVGRGYNRREQTQSPTSHAEIHAIEEASKALGSWRLENCILFVTLEPCPMCLAASQQARVSKIIYGAQDLKGGAISLGYELHKNEKMNHRFEVVYEPHAECSEILSEFFLKKRAEKKLK